PSMRWSFIPLSQYHGGGAAATIEPLHEHLDHYEMMLVSNLGMGVQSVLRGPRLYDTEDTKDMVKRVVDWYKKYRDILESDIIHLRRSDGRDIDYMMHVNPELKEKGFLMVFNPTDRVIRKKIKVPLYYTGISDIAKLREQENQPDTFELNRNYEIEIEVEVAPNWYNWYVIE
ncbi:MAG: alpha-galactosidase, partial [Bacteroidales bacterium]|nr:alpha-galactosidase [Bacteroidales bacterium]